MKERDQTLLDAVKALHQGLVVAHATETCYGLAADIFQKVALEKLYSLKKMPRDKPVSVLVRDLEEAERYGEFSAVAIELALKYWPGPLTIIVPRKVALPKLVNFGQSTVGFRVSSNKKTRQLLEAFGGPLTTTSANIHGQPQAYSVQEMLDQGLVPDFVLDSGRIGENPPSTIVEVMGDEVRVVRQGGLKI
ncbi:MAG: L-threonylcarbamoyladenylate synthase [Candidatus Gracilibacteria bacterium]|jgi:L-threonylcarbamoyladenylate synthase